MKFLSSPFQISLQMGDSFGGKTLGVPYITADLDGDGVAEESYFCEEGFSDAEAAVLCAMLSWPLGKLPSAERLKASLDAGREKGEVGRRQRQFERGRGSFRRPNRRNGVLRG